MQYFTPNSNTAAYYFMFVDNNNIWTSKQLRNIQRYVSSAMVPTRAIENTRACVKIICDKINRCKRVADNLKKCVGLAFRYVKKKVKGSGEISCIQRQVWMGSFIEHSFWEKILG